MQIKAKKERKTNGEEGKKHSRLKDTNIEKLILS